MAAVTQHRSVIQHYLAA